MAKAKATSMFFCQECGYESVKWMGQCPGCHAWNTMVEEHIAPSMGSAKMSSTKVGYSDRKPVVFSEITLDDQARVKTNIAEFDRVLGGGVVPGSLTLVGGDPGIGKSTLLLQVCRQLAFAKQKVLYISGEESLAQIKMRAVRLGEFNDNLSLLCETNLDLIENVVRKNKPDVVIIDSIQTMFRDSVSAAPGSVSQVREATAFFLQMAKSFTISIFIVGHVTKEGNVAGPRVLEHMVDTVLYFEGDRHSSYRILRGVKNRFGSTNEIGVFEMRTEGLVEVLNPSEFMLSGKPEGASGSIVSCSMEGSRPVLIEIQALVCDTSFQIPRRQAAGADYNRVNLLMAVLEKRAGLRLAQSDAYVNIAGGIRIIEPAIDLGIVIAIISSFKNRAMESDIVAFGEVGLSGEIRGVNMTQQRIMEAKKLGFKTCILPKVSLDGLQKELFEGIELIGVSNVQEVQNLL